MYGTEHTLSIVGMKATPPEILIGEVIGDLPPIESFGSRIEV
jgi:hypothetical protein